MTTVKLSYGTQVVTLHTVPTIRVNIGAQQGPRGIQGLKGDTGDTGPQPALSNDTPAALGNAAAGVGTSASRADHVHPLIGVVTLSVNGLATPAILQAALDNAAAIAALGGSLADVAFSGAYADLSGRPSLAGVALSGAYGDLSGRPTLAAVATSGAYGDLSGKPTLGTSAALDVASSLDASPTQVVKGDDSRLVTGIVSTLSALTSGLASVVSAVAALVTGVSTVFGRAGVVVAAVGDYSTTLISDASSYAGASLTATLNTIKASLDALVVFMGALRTTNPNGSTYHLYIAAGGSDANNGLTSGAPIQTLARLVAIFPILCYGAVVIHLDGASRDITTFTVPPRVALSHYCPVIVLGDGASQSGQDGMTVVASGTAGAGTTDLSVVFASGSADLYTNYTFEWAAGTANAGQRATILYSTTAAVFGACRWKSTPTVGDAFRILKPSTIFTYTDTCTFASGIGYDQVNSPLVLANVTFSDTASATTAASPTRHVRLPRCVVVAYGVHVLAGALMPTESYVHAGWLSTNSNGVELVPGQLTPWGTTTACSFVTTAFADLGVDPSLWNGWGVSAPNAANSQRTPIVWDRTWYTGVWGGDYGYIGAGSAFFATGGGVTANGATNGGKLVFAGGSYGNLQSQAVARRSVTSSKTSAGNAFRISCVATGLQILPGSYLEFGELNVSGTSGSSVLIDQSGGTVYAPLASTGLTLSTAGGRGWRMNNHARAHVVTSASSPVSITFSGSGQGIELNNKSDMVGFNHLAVVNGVINANYGCSWCTTAASATVISCTGMTFVGSRIDQQGTGGGATSSWTVTAATTATRALYFTQNSQLNIQDIQFTISGYVQIDKDSPSCISGAVGTSTVNSTGTIAGLFVDYGAKCNMGGVSGGTFAVTQSTAALSAVRLRGELICNNANFSASGTTYGCYHGGGGVLRVNGQPSNISGTTNDFLDEVSTSNAYADTLLSTADSCLFRGQHPLGVASLTTAPTGASFVQRIA